MGKPISQLPSASALSGNELLVLVQNGKTVKITVDDLATSTGFTIDANSNMYADASAFAALTLGTNNLGIGINVGATLTIGNINLLIGESADVAAANTSDAVAVGSLSKVASRGVALGVQAEATGTSSIAVGMSAKATHNFSIVFGDSAQSTAPNQLVFGSAGVATTDVYIGEGVTDTTPSSFILNATGGSGTDIVGANISYAPGKATGNAAGGYHDWLTSDAGASGATLQTNTSKMRLINAGRLGIGTTSPTAILHLKAGTATASTAPLKFTSGTNLTTAEAGAMEYNGTNLFFTRAGTVRENVLVAIDNAAAPSTTAGVTIVNFYGANATNFLGDPNRWASVNILGATYKIPMYT